MDAERIDDVTEWDEEPFAEGFEGLRRLADRDFSGAVTTGTAWLFMLNGRIVGVIDGELDDFGDADGTAFEAPHDSLPLLFAMQELGGDVRAQYYTNDTPLSKADGTLTAGNFTGYVELSENVLSGDYYVAYYGGESLACAFVGNSRKLKTGEEAFDLADDEIGIYRVYDVDLDVREVPDPEAESSGGGATAGGTTAGASGASGSTADADDTEADSDHVGAGEADDDQADDQVDDDQADDDQTDDDQADDHADDTDGEATAGRAAVDDAEPDATTAEDSAQTGGAAPEPSVAGAGETEVEADGEPTNGESTTGGSAEGEPAQGESADHSTANGGVEVVDDAGADPVERAESNEKREPGPSADGERRASVQGANATESATRDDEDVFSEEEQWREARSIPALDPKESADGETAAKRKRVQEERRRARAERDAQSGGRTQDESPSTAAGGPSSRTAGDGTASESESTTSTTADQSAADAGGSGSTTQETDARREAVNERPAVKQSQLQRQVNRLEASLEEAQSEREQVASERDEIASERDEYRDRANQLESRVGELETELERVRSDLREARAQLPDGEQTMTPAEALAGTNLFIRYGSQGGATLEKAQNGDIDREELIQNLRIEHHTSFEDADVVVDGQPYTAFLRDTMEYGFTEWLVQDLLFEIKDTNNESQLQELFDAIPAIDRAEIGGSVSIRIQENGEETREQRTYDLVLRDRMGTPLFVADLNDSRDATPEGTLESLVQDASHIAETDDAFAAGFAVTSSFFEPGALETAADATGGGLLSRSKKKSYVKISRKQGYHLCLAESRDGGFHLTVPEL